MLLSDFLRHELQAFGVHVGCEHGVCGACTVLIERRARCAAAHSYAVQTDGADIVTVEGLADPGAESCCSARSPGITRCNAASAPPASCCSVDAFSARRRHRPSEAEVRDMLSGHICRCTGYTAIVSAVLDAAERNHEEVHD